MGRNILQKIQVAGDHRVAEPPNPFLSATFENDQVIQNKFLPWKFFPPAVSSERVQLIILNFEICPNSSTKNIIGEFNDQIQIRAYVTTTRSIGPEINKCR